jgi:hypothetical protein
MHDLETYWHMWMATRARLMLDLWFRAVEAVIANYPSNGAEIERTQYRRLMGAKQ